VRQVRQIVAPLRKVTLDSWAGVSGNI